MRAILLGDDLSSNLKVIRKYFELDNVNNEGLGPNDILNEIAFHLNNGVTAPEAINMFYGASRIFHDGNQFDRSGRLFFRDQTTIMFRQWLDNEFHIDDDLTMSAVSRLYGAFANFEFRMAGRMHKVMKKQVREADDLVSGSQASRILSYYARTADFTPADIFDVIGHALTKNEMIKNPWVRVQVLGHLATIDSLPDNKVVFGKYTPRSIYGVLSPYADMGLENPLPLKFKVAQEWFEGNTHDDHFEYSDSEVLKTLKGRLAPHITMQKDFANAGVLPQRFTKGIDFVLTFQDASEVGVVCDTRTGYVETFGRERELQANGKVFLSSAFIRKDHPEKPVVRVSGMVAKNTPARELIDALYRATLLKPDVYGINSQREIVPLSQLTIVA